VLFGVFSLDSRRFPFACRARAGADQIAPVGGAVKATFHTCLGSPRTLLHHVSVRPGICRAIRLVWSLTRPLLFFPLLGSGADQIAPVGGPGKMQKSFDGMMAGMPQMPSGAAPRR
jgi:hypothetical protein